MTTTPAAGHAHGHAEAPPKAFGLLAEFETPDALIEATKKARAEGYTHLDTHTPYPLGETADALGFPKSEMGVVMFMGGLTGAFAGFFMQYWGNAYGYPLIVGGRPFFSWPSFVPVTFEMMVLTAALSGLFGLIALCGLPQYYHPWFNSKAFDRASRDRFFLSLEATDPKYDSERSAAFLRTLNPASVEEVTE
jgi:hypothetical protein